MDHHGLMRARIEDFRVAVNQWENNPNGAAAAYKIADSSAGILAELDRVRSCLAEAGEMFDLLLRHGPDRCPNTWPEGCAREMMAIASGASDRAWGALGWPAIDSP